VSEEQWGYLVWGLLAGIVAFPEILAGVGRELVPFPGFARTVIYLQARRPLLTMILLGLFAVIVAFPEILAAVGRELVPFPGFARTVIYLQARRPLLTMILLGLFAVLIVHIIWYPWPDRP
jgi:type IV secretory pathway VirB3-like protein